MLLLIPILPFLGFLVNAGCGRRISKAAAGAVACAAMLASFGMSMVEVWQLAGLPPEGRALVQWCLRITSGDFNVGLTPGWIRRRRHDLVVLVFVALYHLLQRLPHEEIDPSSPAASRFEPVCLIHAGAGPGANFLVMFVGGKASACV
jgi:hypothetical protein